LGCNKGEWLGEEGKKCAFRGLIAVNLGGWLVLMEPISLQIDWVYSTIFTYGDVFKTIELLSAAFLCNFSVHCWKEFITQG